MSYTEVSVGRDHTVLLRSDGTAVACGLNNDGQCNIPSLKSWRDFLTFAPASRRYVCHPRHPSRRMRVLQLDFVGEAGAFMLTCSSLAGHEVLNFAARALTLLRIFTKKLPRSWMPQSTVFKWSCPMDSCWPPSTEQHRRPHF